MSYSVVAFKKGMKNPIIEKHVGRFMAETSLFDFKQRGFDAHMEVNMIHDPKWNRNRHHNKGHLLVS